MAKQQTNKITKFLNYGTTPSLSGLSSRLRAYLPRHIPIAVKLSFAVSILVTTGMILLGSVVITNQEKLLRNQIDAHGNTVAIQLAESAKELILADDRLSLGVLTRNMANDESILGTSVFDDKGNALASSGVTPLASGDELVNVRNLMDSNTHSMEWHHSIDWLIRIIKDKLGCNNLDARIQLGIQTVKDLAIKRQMIKRLQGII